MKKFLPSSGFVMLFSTIIFVVFFIRWVFQPPSYEKAMLLEQKAHHLTKNGKLKKAKNYFLAAAKLKDDNISTSRRYRCVASVSSDATQKIKYAKLALKYNPDNQNAKNELKFARANR